jgi:hypothetical protein
MSTVAGSPLQPLDRPSIVERDLDFSRGDAERRAILEERSAHIAIGLRYLPAVARRLYQSRDLGEPFDFLTRFEYAPVDTAPFDDLVHQLRLTEEWRYVEREVDIRLQRAF